MHDNQVIFAFRGRLFTPYLFSVHVCLSEHSWFCLCVCLGWSALGWRGRGGGIETCLTSNACFPWTPVYTSFIFYPYPPVWTFLILSLCISPMFFVNIIFVCRPQTRYIVKFWTGAKFTELSLPMTMAGRTNGPRQTIHMHQIIEKQQQQQKTTTTTTTTTTTRLFLHQGDHNARHDPPNKQ